MKKRSFLRAALLTLGLLALVTWGSQVEAAKESFDRSKPHVSISVETEGVALGGFQQLDGFGIDIEVIEYGSGDDPVVRKRPGRGKHGDITLERPYEGATDVQGWAAESTRGKVQRSDVSLVMLDPAARVVRAFTLFDCFPSSWKLSTNSQGFLVETLTLAVEYVEMVE